MSAEENKAVIHACVEALNRKDISFMDIHPGLAGIKPFFRDLFAAFPDLHCTPQTTVATDAWVAESMMISGTMQGPFMGTAPTGKHATWTGIGMYRIVEGKIVELLALADDLAMMRQLGIGLPGGAPTPD